MLPFNPDMDNYTDNMFEKEKDLADIPDSFVTNLPRFQRGYVVETVLTCNYPLYIVDDATGPSGEALNNTVELHCSDPVWRKKYINEFWEIFDAVASIRFRK